MIGGTVAVGPSSFGVCSGALRAGVGGVGDWITRVFVGEGVAGGAVLPSTAPRAGVGGCGDGAAVSTEATRVTGGSGDKGAGNAQAAREASATMRINVLRIPYFVIGPHDTLREAAIRNTPLRQRIGQQFNGMLRLAARAALDLVAARHARGGDQRFGGSSAHRGEEPLFADGLRKAVMLRLVAE